MRSSGDLQATGSSYSIKHLGKISTRHEGGGWKSGEECVRMLANKTLYGVQYQATKANSSSAPWATTASPSSCLVGQSAVRSPT